MKRKIISRVLSCVLALSLAVGNGTLSVWATEDEITSGADSGISLDEESTSQDAAESVDEITDEKAESSVDAPVTDEDTVNTESIVQDEVVESEEPSLYFSSGTYVSETHDVFSRTTSTIAPGVTQDIVYAYAKDGNQMVYYVATADITRDDVNVYANYKDNQCTEFGMAKLTEQMASAQAKHTNPDDPENYIENYNVVAGTNADFYNMTTGRPSGAFVMEGVITNTANNRPFFAILKDGTAVIGANNTDWNEIADQVQEAVGGSQVLVKNGVDVTASATGTYNTDRHSRTCVGITAEGKVVMMVLDGRQVPFSCGGSMHELAQIMLEAGCVAAINLDGGGSTTFAARQEGENEVSVVNRPSDGSERSISSSLMVVSTAPPSDVFDHAVLTAEESYITPGSTVNISATGVSPAGTAAEIPTEASWQLADSSFGTVENGVFTSNGTTGDAVIQMIYNGTVVAETTVHVVIPDTIQFSSDVITVPYNKTVTLDIVATYGLNKVALKESDVEISLSEDSLGTIEGFDFTACEENEEITEGIVSAVLVEDAEVTCSATVTLGKASEILADFEAGVPESYSIKTTYPEYGPMGSKKDENGNYYYNGQNECGRIYAVTAETGQVRNGEQAMAVECDYSQIYETGWHGLNLTGLNFSVDASAQAIGMWVYMPELEDVVGTNVRLVGKTAGGASVNAEFWLVGYCTSIEHDGWHYFSFDLSEVSDSVTFNTMQLYINDRDNSTYNYLFKEHSSVNGKFTYYIDDITVDYSSAVDDREEPVFEYVRASYGGLSDAVDLNGQTIGSNVVSVTAKVSDDTSKTNAVGLDISTAKAYIDGIELTNGFSCSDAGVMTIEDVTLADGTHTFKFEICDKMGNKSYIKRQIIIAAESGMANISIVPADPEADKLLIGSIYWMNIVASNIEKVQSITTELNLNSVSTWELDHMEVAEGYEATYTIDKVTNNATITITKTGTNNAAGEMVLAQLPIRTWVSRLTEYEGYEASTPEKLWSRKIIWPMDIKLDVNMGSVVFTDGTTGSFAMTPVAVDTELYGNYAELNANGDYSNKTSWHVHTAEALEDAEATCTKDGYAGRTFCYTCNSVVEWGNADKKTGHTYVADGDTVKCENCNTVIPSTYTGFLEGKDGRYYLVNGKTVTGWRAIGGDYYYFRSSTKLAATGKYMYSSWIYTFDEIGKLIEGAWEKTENGNKYWYGPSFYQHEWATIDGKEYFFDSSGYPCTGYTCIIASAGNDPQWYEFDENGVLIRKIDSTGLFEVDGKTYYLNNGVSCTGLILAEDGYYYYFVSKDFSAVKGTSYYCTNLNDTGFEKGWRDFDEKGRMILETEDSTKDGFVEEDGNLYYYENGVKTYAGLIIIDGSYYYVNSSCKVITNQSYWISKTNDLLPSGMYDFDENGKMIVEVEDPTKDGFVDENGTTYYYVNGVKAYAGLIQVNGNYYYVNSSCIVIKSQSYWISKTNDLLETGMYQFDENGCIVFESEEPVKDGIVNEDGTLYYYENGVKVYAGLIQIDGDYYYVNSSCKVIANQCYTISKTNNLLPSGVYQFDENGKMIVEAEDPTKEGIVNENGTLYYYEAGLRVYAGLIQIDGDYYYVNSSCKVITNQSYWISKTNDLLPSGMYDFDEDGKMIQ